MESVIFVDPSPNMYLVCDIMLKKGIKTECVYTKNYEKALFNNFWGVLFGKLNLLNDTDKIAKNKNEPDKLVNSIKKPMISYWINKKISNKLFQKEVRLKDQKFNDFIALDCSVKKYSKENVKCTHSCITEVMAYYKNSIIMSSYMINTFGNFYQMSWKTDYDIESSLRKDLFLLYNEDGKHILFCMDGELVVISKSRPESGFLKRLNPSFEKFEFTLSNIQAVSMNSDPWISKISQNFYLINDYSWGNFYVQMSDIWGAEFVKSLNFEKVFLK